MSKKNTTPTTAPSGTGPEYPAAPTTQETLLPSTLLNIENYIGQPVIVHSAPTAWHGYLVAVERRGEAVGVTLADAGLWINGELKEVIRPGERATRDTESSHHHLAYIPIVTALQPGAAPFTLKSWSAQNRGRRPGDPNRITLQAYADNTGTDVPTAIAAIENCYKASKGFESVVGLVSGFADEMCFPAPAVASMLMSQVLAYKW